MTPCPVHGELVALDPDGRLLGRCQACMEEAAEGLYLITSGVASARHWAAATLARRRAAHLAQTQSPPPDLAVSRDGLRENGA